MEGLVIMSVNDSAVDNIRLLHEHNSESAQIFNTIESFLSKRAKNSVRTMQEYKRDIEKFFKIVRNKTFSQLIVDDLKIKYEEVEKYQLILDEFYSESSVNRMIASITSFYQYLEKNEYPVKSINFKVERLKASKKSRHPSVNWETAEQCIELVKKTRKGDIKSLLIEFACVTCFRKEAILGITWNDFEQVDGIWQVSTKTKMDKGQKILKASLHDDFMERLLKLKSINSYKESKVFQISLTSVDQMMPWLSERINKHIVFHSFKKCGINEVGNQTGGNIKSMQTIGHHESAQTTLDNYTELEDNNPANHPSLLIGAKVDSEIIESLSQEELVKLFHSMNRATQLQMVNKAKTLQ